MGNGTVIRATAPGSVMLLGEHAVLRGKQAVVAAVDRCIHVTLRPRADRRIVVASDLGNGATSVEECRLPSPLRFVQAALRQHQRTLPGGMELTITSDLPATLGLGSSAAVTAAMLGAVRAWLGLPAAAHDLLNETVTVIRRAQGMGSGADAAASLFGGTLLFQSCPTPTVVERFEQPPPIVLCASGVKTPTPRVVERVEQFRQHHPRVIDTIDNAVHQTVIEAASAIKQGDLPRLGRLFNVNHGLMNALGVSNALLEEMVWALRGEPTIHGAKISGAGLGDCIVGVGHITGRQRPWEIVPTTITNKGLIVDTRRDS